MKQKYYLNNRMQANGDYEVHASTCKYFPLMYSVTYLGEFDTCSDAVRAAKRRYPQANGCYYCSNPCHTT
ncbi:hypothetical protein [Chitinophaga rhizosphaerae]|uniref:hypothetical protein n=1 Tax=Chitinophaga rhizosphaerae TaxID=1864947 RepID=UPI00196B09DC|nr:hypothetical protein [Chitinophaga rhizosphaerae]